MTHLEREKKLHLYLDALERGDFEMVSAILLQAEQDTELEKMIMNVSMQVADEYDVTVQEETTQLVHQIIETHLRSGAYGIEEEFEIPPIKLSDVANKLISDVKLPLQMQKEVQGFAQQLYSSQATLPARFNRHVLASLLDQLGVSVSISLKKLFHETAVMLSMGREQNQAQLAATRRQRIAATKESSKGEAAYDKQKNN